MCEPEDIQRLHRQTNDEIRYILAKLSEHAEVTNDKQLDRLIIDLREVLAKRFLINGIVDWQHEGEG